MKKNYFFSKLILCGLFTLATATTFVGCKDYDDDISNLQTQITANSEAIKKLQDLVSAGKFVTAVTGTEDGIKVTMNDGTSTEIKSVSGKDGKDGTVWTISDDGFWVKDNVPTTIKAVGKDGEAGKDGHEVKISEDGYWMVWDTEAGDYVKTDYIAGGASAAKIAGGWNIFIKDDAGVMQTVFVPDSATLGSIDFVEASGEWVGEMDVYYGIVTADTKYGVNADIAMPKGIYSKLDRDLKILINPQGVDASEYTFDFYNSANQRALVDFEAAEPFVGVLTRAASESGIWKLPAKAHADLGELDVTRVDFYKYFKPTDGDPFQLTLTATNGKTTVKSPYDASVDELVKVDDAKIGINDIYSCLINVDYYPSFAQSSVSSSVPADSSKVYDYWLTLEQSPANLRLANAYGVQFGENNHSFRFTKESGVYNNVKFIYNYVLLNGKIGKAVAAFNAKFTEEPVSSDAINLDTYRAPFNAVVLKAADYGKYNFDANKQAQVNAGGKVFVLSPAAIDLDSYYNAMSATDKLIFAQAVATNGSIDAVLEGGEPDNNNIEKDNIDMLNRNISYRVYKDNTDKKYKLQVNFFVSPNWNYTGVVPTGQTNQSMSNFTLDNMYRLTLTVNDPETSSAFRTINLPFELQAPEAGTIGIEHRNGEFATWSTVKVGNNNVDVLTAYGSYYKDGSNVEWMKLPLYEAFDAYTDASYTENDNVPYYKLGFEQIASFTGIEIVGHTGTVAPAPIVTYAISGMYNANSNAWTTFAPKGFITRTQVVNGQTVPFNYVENVVAEYYVYGVYPVNVPDFRLVFESMLRKSTLAITPANNGVTEQGIHTSIITNAQIDFKTPQNKAFYLFDGIKNGGSVDARADMNQNSYDETKFGLFFNAATANIITAKAADGTAINVNYIGTADIEYSADRTKRYYVPTTTPAAAAIQIYVCPAVKAQPKDATVNLTNDKVDAAGTAEIIPVAMDGIPGGLMVQLGANLQVNTPVTITLTLTDHFGVTNEVSFQLKKFQN